MRARSISLAFAALLSAAPAAAQGVDMTRLTCAEFGTIAEDEQVFVLAWFNGYLNGLAGNTRLDPPEFMAGVAKIKAFCAANGAITVVQAVPRALTAQAADPADKTGTIPVPPAAPTTTVVPPVTPAQPAAPAAPRKPTPQ